MLPEASKVKITSAGPILVHHGIVGAAVVSSDGASVGPFVGTSVGRVVGLLVGVTVGVAEGD